MKTETINGYKLELYDGADELPADRFNLLNLYMLVDSGIGSDINDFSAKVSRISKLIDGDTKAAKIELYNLRQSLFMIAEGVNPKHLAFTAFIKSINGRTIPVNLSSDEAHRIVKQLGRVKHSWIKHKLEELRGKLKRS